MKLTENQQIVIDLARKNGNRVTKSQICAVIRYFNNTEKYVGMILTRMVKKNHIKRIKKGLYEISNGIIEIENQTKLF